LAFRWSLPVASRGIVFQVAQGHHDGVGLPRKEMAMGNTTGNTMGNKEEK
jgi:hypothetical protein